MSAGGGIRLPFQDIPAPGPWRAEGACAVVATEVFFPGRGQPLHEAKGVCETCPVVDACRDYAVPLSELKGVWGGLSEVERRRLRAKRAAVTTPAPDRSRQGRRPACSDDGGLYTTLVALTASPGRWAQVALYPQSDEAAAVAAGVRAGRVAVPRGRWRFAAQPSRDGSVLLACFGSAVAARRSTGIAS